MSRSWNEFVAALGDVVPVPLLALILLAVTAIVAALWYWWPEWLPGRRRGGRRRFRWRWPRFRRPNFRRLRLRLRWRRRRRHRRPEPTGDGYAERPGDELPELPAATLTLSADEFAAQGRYREAVRERLRAVVRDLVERNVITHHPGWTVTELAAAAGRARPATAAPLGAASDVFSRIWYAQQPADATHDQAMREYAAGVRAALDLPVGVRS